MGLLSADESGDTYRWTRVSRFCYAPDIPGLPDTIY